MFVNRDMAFLKKKTHLIAVVVIMLFAILVVFSIIIETTSESTDDFFLNGIRISNLYERINVTVYQDGVNNAQLQLRKTPISTRTYFRIGDASSEAVFDNSTNTFSVKLYSFDANGHEHLSDSYIQEKMENTTEFYSPLLSQFNFANGMRLYCDFGMYEISG